MLKPISVQAYRRTEWISRVVDSMLKHSKTVCACKWILVNCHCLKDWVLLCKYIPMWQVPSIREFVLTCQIALQFSVPNLKAELLRLWLSPRCPSSSLWGGDSPVPLIPSAAAAQCVYCTPPSLSPCSMLALPSRCWHLVEVRTDVLSSLEWSRTCN